MNKQLTIGLFGFGVVGKGLYDVLQRTPGMQALITKICILHPNKPRAIAKEHFTTNKWDILDDDNVNVVVELINDPHSAFSISIEAMKRGKHVVTANKAMIAQYYTELLQVQQQTGVSLLYEASSCGSIPIIRNLEEYYDNDLLSGVEGIVNGTTNYILWNLQQQPKATYSQVLQAAQDAGFAEADPTLDVEGWDATYKTTIIAAHAFGVLLPPEKIPRRGITAISSFDVHVAKHYGCVIKLISSVHTNSSGVVASVLPTFVPTSSLLATIQNEVNAVQLKGAFSDAQILIGKGAGAFPTASAVLSDIAALRYDYRYEYKRVIQHNQLRLPHEPIANEVLRVYVRAEDEYLRLLPWISVDVDHRSTKGSYVIGTINLLELQQSPVFVQPQASIIRFGSGNEPFNQ
jgi:homoserine dehydrogenase